MRAPGMHQLGMQLSSASTASVGHHAPYLEQGSAWRILATANGVMILSAVRTIAVKGVMSSALRGCRSADSCGDLQRMEPSNVSGGYWQQLPSKMQRRWPFKEKIEVELECEDVSRKHSALKKENRLATWQYQVPSLLQNLSESSQRSSAPCSMQHRWHTHQSRQDLGQSLRDVQKGKVARTRERPIICQARRKAAASSSSSAAGLGRSSRK